MKAAIHDENSMVGLDLTMSVFQIPAVEAEGPVVVPRHVKRARLLVVLSRVRPGLLGRQACAAAHHGGGNGAIRPRDRADPAVLRRALRQAGHKGCCDAEAIWIAVTRPTMRFVPVTTEARRAVLMQHRSRDLLVRQLPRKPGEGIRHQLQLAHRVQQL